MSVYHDSINIVSKGENDIIDITKDIQKIVSNSGLKEGLCVVFVPGSTATLSTMEYEDGLKHDVPNALEKIAPKNQEYQHHLTWHDNNGRSHVKATLIGPSLTIPFQNRSILHGTWQQLVFIELDTQSRRRTLIVQLVGE
ncbi:secondary thiamine-phosphate synthase enzyme [Thermoplasmatales archaeon SM1-50]|nr:MAG: secondary thiamine-phosphate synthase enzyme [Thermoplasmatales archaeon SM1-50]